MAISPVAFDVEDVGRFVAKRRTIAVDMAVERERCIQLAGIDSPSEDMLVLALVWAESKQGLEQAPEGWKPEDQSSGDLMKVYAALRSAFEPFREPDKSTGAPAREGA